MISIRHHAPCPSFKVHGNYFVVWTVRNIDILYPDINLWLHVTQSLGNLLLSVVSNLLSQYLQ